MARYPDYRSKRSAIAVGLTTRQADAVTAATLTHRQLWEMNFPQLVPMGQTDDANKMTGEILATEINRAGHTGEWSASQAEAEPQHCGFLLGYGLGESSVSIPTAGVYLHTFTPQDKIELPYATLGNRFGANIATLRHVGAAVNSLRFEMGRSGFLGVSGNILMTGNFDTDMVEEVVAALDNATSLTLAARGIHGATAQARLDALWPIESDYAAVGSNYITHVVPSAASDASPAVITIPSVGGAGATVNYRIMYRTDTDVAWATFPAFISQSPFTIGNATLKVNGEWNGSTYSGGRTLGCDVEGLTWEWNNNATVKPCISGSGRYGDIIQVGQASSTISLPRQLQDWWFQHYAQNSRLTSMYLKLTQQDAITGAYYPYIEFIWPRLGIPSNPISDNGGLLQEDNTLQVLSDTTYGEVIVNMQDTVASYAAAA